MKKLFIILLGLGLNSSVFADSEHYFGVQLGANQISERNLTSNLGNNVEVSGKVEFKSGVHAGLVLGKEIDKMRYEIEYQYGEVKIKNISLGAVSGNVSDSGHYESLTLNAYLTQNLSEKITGFVGAGLGVGKIEMPRASLISNCNCIDSTSGNGAVYQAKIGLEYQIQKDQKIGIQYTVLNLPKLSSSQTNYENNNIKILGITYRKLF